MASNTVPWLQLPSPPKATETFLLPRLRQAMAAPTASGGPPPTIAFAPNIPLVTSAMCIEPPLPLHRPPLRP